LADWCTQFLSLVPIDPSHSDAVSILTVKSTSLLTCQPIGKL